jgi:hypothetical protein
MIQAVSHRIRSRSDNSFIEEPDVPAGLADHHLEDLYYDIPAEGVVVLLVVDDCSTTHSLK